MRLHKRHLWRIGLPLGMVIATGTVVAECKGNLCIPRQNLFLLQPLGPTQTIEPQTDIQVFFVYFNDIWPWLIGVAAGVAVLQALVGGVQMMMSGSSEKAAEGKTRLVWALGGIVVIAFAGFVLRLLNNIFYF